MIEFMKHSLGLCGEPHLNIFTIMMSAPIVSYLIYKFFKI